MPQAEEICQHVVMVHRGRKVLDESLAAIRSRHDPRSIRFEPLDPEADTTSLASLPGVESLRGEDRGLEIRLRQGTDPSAAMRLILETIPAARIELSRPRLEDVFLQRASDTRTPEDERQLRAELRNPATEETE